MHFWQKLPKPFFVLAPLADVTDASFRRVIAKYSAHKRSDGTIGGPDVMWTEFVSADGLIRASEEGKQKLMADLLYSEEERPIVAQLFSSRPEYIEQAARLCKQLGFDGIDINMGCPDKGIEKQGCGSAMIKHPEIAQAVIAAAQKGAEGLPVSVKTRIGYNKNELETWLPFLLACEPAVITIHARTRKEMSKVPARWEHVARAVEIRNQMGSSTLIVGNGDALSLEDAQHKAQESGADGAMLGRAIFGNPWLFHPTKRLPEHSSDLDSSAYEVVTLKERFEALVEHTHLFEDLLPHKSFALMKKHYKAYINGFDGAKELRHELMELSSAEEVASRLAAFMQSAGKT